MIHSHEYSPGEWLRRSFDEARALREVYGWVEPPGVRRCSTSGATWAPTGAGRARAETSSVGRRARCCSRAPFSITARGTAGAVLGARCDRLPPRSCDGCRSSAELRARDAAWHAPRWTNRASSPATLSAMPSPALVGGRLPGGGRALGQQDASASPKSECTRSRSARCIRGAASAIKRSGRSTTSRSRWSQGSSSGSPGATAAARARC